MAFGLKNKTIKTSRKYTIESFFEAIKDKQFSAGVPTLTKQGMVPIITFPALDDRTQIWIMRAGFGAETNKFQVQKREKAGMDSLLTNAAVDGLTRGWSKLGRMVGDNAQQCERLMALTVQELNALGL